MKTIQICCLLLLLVFYVNTKGQNGTYVSQENMSYHLTKIAEGDYSTPQFSPDGKFISFTNKGFAGIMLMNTKSGDVFTLTSALGAGYKYAWSLDNEHLAYRGSRFEGNRRTQFIGVIHVAEGKEDIIATSTRFQPAAWQYFEDKKRLVFLQDDVPSFSRMYSVSKEIEVHPNINTYFYYKEGGFYVLNDKTTTLDGFEKIEGMDPIVSPDGRSFIYSKNDRLVWRSLEEGSEQVLGQGSHPSWSPDGKQIVYQITSDNGHSITGSDLYIMNMQTQEVYRLTHTEDIQEVNASWSPDGSKIIFNDERDGYIYLITFN